jgi:hypothetical protein
MLFLEKHDCFLGSISSVGLLSEPCIDTEGVRQCELDTHNPLLALENAPDPLAFASVKLLGVLDDTINALVSGIPMKLRRHVSVGLKIVCP